MVASPMRVPLVEPRSSTMTSSPTMENRACCRERLASGITTSDGWLRPTTSGTVDGSGTI